MHNIVYAIMLPIGRTSHILTVISTPFLQPLITTPLPPYNQSFPATLPPIESGFVPVYLNGLHHQ
jgi:hypothetical protein